MSADRAMCWLLGSAFVVMFVMFNLAINDRNTSRRAIVEMNGAQITVTCKAYGK